MFDCGCKRKSTHWTHRLSQALEIFWLATCGLAALEIFWLEASYSRKLLGNLLNNSPEIPCEALKPPNIFVQLQAAASPVNSGKLLGTIMPSWLAACGSGDFLA